MKILRCIIGLNLAALLGVSVWFRCRDLGELPGVNGDEAWYGVQAERVLHGEPIAWRTPTGNLLNPLFFGPQLLLHALFEPSFALLRVTAVASGLLALALNYFLCRKVFGGRAAAISTTILAVLPVNIIYSRLAWDASQSLLVTLPAIYWSLRAIVVPPWRLWFSAGGLIALSAAIVIHPTNLFVAPVVGVCLAVAWREELRFLWRHPAGQGLVASAAIAAFFIGSVLDQSRFFSILSRLSDPTAYAAFAVNLGRLFSGATVYEYVAGSIDRPIDVEWLSGTLPSDLAVAAIACLVVWGVSKRRVVEPVVHDSNADDAEYIVRRTANLNCATAALAIGWAMSIFAFFVIAGVAALGPHFERYALCLVAPGAILTTLAIESWINQRSYLGRFMVGFSVVCGWALLASFQSNFFDFLNETGGRSHRTFRTGSVEPKAAAFRLIGQRSTNARVLTSEWWNYWPLEYLSLDRPTRFERSAGDVRRSPDSDRPHVIVEQWDSGYGFDPPLPKRGEQLWVVEYSDSSGCEAVRRWSLAHKVPLAESTIQDAGGKPVLTLFQVGATARLPRSTKP